MHWIITIFRRHISHRSTFFQVYGPNCRKPLFSSLRSSITHLSWDFSGEFSHDFCLYLYFPNFRSKIRPLTSCSSSTIGLPHFLTSTPPCRRLRGSPTTFTTCISFASQNTCRWGAFHFRWYAVIATDRPDERRRRVSWQVPPCRRHRPLAPPPPSLSTSPTRRMGAYAWQDRRRRHGVTWRSDASDERLNPASKRRRIDAIPHDDITSFTPLAVWRFRFQRSPHRARAIPALASDPASHQPSTTTVHRFSWHSLRLDVWYVYAVKNTLTFFDIQAWTSFSAHFLEEVALPAARSALPVFRLFSVEILILWCFFSISYLRIYLERSEIQSLWF